LLSAFSFFWGYIWFCQAMLIWYANIPEETIHYATRFSGGWSALFWLNPIINLAVPFITLVSMNARRNPGVVSQVAVVVLVGHALDMFLLVAPALGPAGGLAPLAAIAGLAAIGAGMLVKLGRDRLVA